MIEGIPLHSITEVRGFRIVKKGLSLKARRPEDQSVIAGDIAEVIGTNYVSWRGEPWCLPKMQVEAATVYAEQ
jgi:hypothetical protein